MNYNNCFKGNNSCPKAGIKIHESNSVTNTNEDLFRPSTVRTPVNFYQTSLNHLDLDLDHYSLEDLYKLFNILDHDLSEQMLKNAKQIAYKIKTSIAGLMRNLRNTVVKKTMIPIKVTGIG